MEAIIRVVRIKRITDDPYRAMWRGTVSMLAGEPGLPYDLTLMVLTALTGSSLARLVCSANFFREPVSAAIVKIAKRCGGLRLMADLGIHKTRSVDELERRCEIIRESLSKATLPLEPTQPSATWASECFEAVSVLSDLTNNCDHNVTMLVHQSGLEILLKLVDSERMGRGCADPVASLTVSVALSILWRVAGCDLDFAQICERMVSLGAIPIITNELIRSHRTCQSHAAGALSCLAYSSVERQNAILEAGALEPLVRYCWEGDPSTQANAAATLNNLCCGPDTICQEVLQVSLNIMILVFSYVVFVTDSF